MTYYRIWLIMGVLAAMSTKQMESDAPSYVLTVLFASSIPQHYIVIFAITLFVVAFVVFIIAFLLFKFWYVLFPTRYSSQTSHAIGHKPPNTLRMLTYNFFLRPIFAHDKPSDYKTERMNRFIDNHFKEYDILFLQEVWEVLSPRKSHFLNEATKAGFFSAANTNPPLFSSKFTDSGLLVLSRLPIVEVDFLQFEHSSWPDSGSRKGVLYTKISTTEDSPRYIHAFNTHLQSAYILNDLKSYQVQQQQLAQLQSYVLEKMASFGVADTAIICGDFNIDARSLVGMSSSSKSKSQYMDVMNMFPDFIDTLRLHTSYSPTTAICNYDSTGKVVATVPLPQQYVKENNFQTVHHCLDYFLVWKGNPAIDSRTLTDKAAPYRHSSSHIREFPTDIGFGFLSDHFGVHALFQLTSS